MSRTKPSRAFPTTYLRASLRAPPAAPAGFPRDPQARGAPTSPSAAARTAGCAGDNGQATVGRPAEARVEGLPGQVCPSWVSPKTVRGRLRGERVKRAACKLRSCEVPRVYECTHLAHLTKRLPIGKCVESSGNSDARLAPPPRSRRG